MPTLALVARSSEATCGPLPGSLSAFEPWRPPIRGPGRSHRAELTWIGLPGGNHPNTAMNVLHPLHKIRTSNKIASGTGVRPEGNYLFGALPEETRERLLPGVSLVDIPRGKALHEPGRANREVYFPIDAVVSILYVTGEGRTAGLAVIGNEGLVGVSSFLSGFTPPHLALVHSPGRAYRIPAQRLSEAFGWSTGTQRVLLRYTQSVITQMGQTAVCNRHHSIYQQLCRLFLLSLDRLPGNQIAITQETTASILGVRREGVTLAARKLQEEGIIDCTRGKVIIRDRKRLEQAGCECYTVVTRETLRLQPHLPWSKAGANDGEPGRAEGGVWRP